MRITVNGEERQVAAESTLGSLLDGLKVRREGTAVARNDEVVPLVRADATPLAPGDRIEIIVAVAGG
ncbi:MAG: sulfur carrier protein ThiS [Candidatus Velthaea sp.]|jgi:sulfur carrier protein